MARYLAIDADPEPFPDPAYHFDVNPDPNFFFDADADPGNIMMWILADPDP